MQQLPPRKNLLCDYWSQRQNNGMKAPDDRDEYERPVHDRDHQRSREYRRREAGCDPIAATTSDHEPGYYDYRHRSLDADEPYILDYQHVSHDVDDRVMEYEVKPFRTSPNRHRDDPHDLWEQQCAKWENGYSNKDCQDEKPYHSRQSGHDYLDRERGHYSHRRPSHGFRGGSKETGFYKRGSRANGSNVEDYDEGDQLRETSKYRYMASNTTENDRSSSKDRRNNDAIPGHSPGRSYHMWQEKEDRNFRREQDRSREDYRHGGRGSRHDIESIHARVSEDGDYIAEGRHSRKDRGRKVQRESKENTRYSDERYWNKNNHAPEKRKSQKTREELNNKYHQRYGSDSNSSSRYSLRENSETRNEYIKKEITSPPNVQRAHRSSSLESVINESKAGIDELVRKLDKNHHGNVSDDAQTATSSATNVISWGSTVNTNADITTPLSGCSMSVTTDTTSTPSSIPLNVSSAPTSHARNYSDVKSNCVAQTTTTIARPNSSVSPSIKPQAEVIVECSVTKVTPSLCLLQNSLSSGSTANNAVVSNISETLPEHNALTVSEPCLSPDIRSEQSIGDSQKKSFTKLSLSHPPSQSQHSKNHKAKHNQSQTSQKITETISHSDSTSSLTNRIQKQSVSRSSVEDVQSKEEAALPGHAKLVNESSSRKRSLNINEGSELPEASSSNVDNMSKIKVNSLVDPKSAESNNHKRKNKAAAMRLSNDSASALVRQTIAPKHADVELSLEENRASKPQQLSKVPVKLKDNSTLPGKQVKQDRSSSIPQQCSNMPVKKRHKSRSSVQSTITEKSLFVSPPKNGTEQSNVLDNPMQREGIRCDISSCMPIGVSNNDSYMSHSSRIDAPERETILATERQISEAGNAVDMVSGASSEPSTLPKNTASSQEPTKSKSSSKKSHHYRPNLKGSEGAKNVSSKTGRCPRPSQNPCLGNLPSDVVESPTVGKEFLDKDVPAKTVDRSEHMKSLSSHRRSSEEFVTITKNTTHASIPRDKKHTHSESKSLKTKRKHSASRTSSLETLKPKVFITKLDAKEEPNSSLGEPSLCKDPVVQIRTFSPPKGQSLHLQTDSSTDSSLFQNQVEHVETSNGSYVHNRSKSGHKTRRSSAKPNERPPVPLSESFVDSRISSKETPVANHQCDETSMAFPIPNGKTHSNVNQVTGKSINTASARSANKSQHPKTTVLKKTNSHYSTVLGTKSTHTHNNISKVRDSKPSEIAADVSRTAAHCIENSKKSNVTNYSRQTPQTSKTDGQTQVDLGKQCNSKISAKSHGTSMPNSNSQMKNKSSRKFNIKSFVKNSPTKNMRDVMKMRNSMPGVSTCTTPVTQRKGEPTQGTSRQTQKRPEGRSRSGNPQLPVQTRELPKHTKRLSPDDMKPGPSKIDIEKRSRHTSDGKLNTKTRSTSVEAPVIRIALKLKRPHCEIDQKPLIEKIETVTLPEPVAPIPAKVRKMSPSEKGDYKNKPQNVHRPSLESKLTITAEVDSQKTETCCSKRYDSNVQHTNQSAPRKSRDQTPKARRASSNLGSDEVSNDAKARQFLNRFSRVITPPHKMVGADDNAVSADELRHPSPARISRRTFSCPEKGATNIKNALHQRHQPVSFLHCIQELRESNIRTDSVNHMEASTSKTNSPSDHSADETAEESSFEKTLVIDEARDQSESRDVPIIQETTSTRDTTEVEEPLMDRRTPVARPFEVPSRNYQTGEHQKDVTFEREQNSQRSDSPCQLSQNSSCSFASEAAARLEQMLDADSRSSTTGETEHNLSKNVAVEQNGNDIGQNSPQTVGKKKSSEPITKEGPLSSGASVVQTLSTNSKSRIEASASVDDNSAQKSTHLEGDDNAKHTRLTRNPRDDPDLLDKSGSGIADDHPPTDNGHCERQPLRNTQTGKPSINNGTMISNVSKEVNESPTETTGMIVPSDRVENHEEKANLVLVEQRIISELGLPNNNHQLRSNLTPASMAYADVERENKQLSSLDHLLDVRLTSTEKHFVLMQSILRHFMCQLLLVFDELYNRANPELQNQLRSAQMLLADGKIVQDTARQIILWANQFQEALRIDESVATRKRLQWRINQEIVCVAAYLVSGGSISGLTSHLATEMQRQSSDLAAREPQESSDYSFMTTESSSQEMTQLELSVYFMYSYRVLIYIFEYILNRFTIKLHQDPVIIGKTIKSKDFGDIKGSFLSLLTIKKVSKDLENPNWSKNITEWTVLNSQTEKTIIKALERLIQLVVTGGTNEEFVQFHCDYIAENKSLLDEIYWRSNLRCEKLMQNIQAFYQKHVPDGTLFKVQLSATDGSTSGTSKSTASTSGTSKSTDSTSGTSKSTDSASGASTSASTSTNCTHENISSVPNERCAEVEPCCSQLSADNHASMVTATAPVCGAQHDGQCQPAGSLLEKALITPLDQGQKTTSFKQAQMKTPSEQRQKVAKKDSRDSRKKNRGVVHNSNIPETTAIAMASSQMISCPRQNTQQRTGELQNNHHIPLILRNSKRMGQEVSNGQPSKRFSPEMPPSMPVNFGNHNGSMALESRFNGQPPFNPACAWSSTDGYQNAQVVNGGPQMPSRPTNMPVRNSCHGTNQSVHNNLASHAMMSSRGPSQHGHGTTNFAPQSFSGLPAERTDGGPSTHAIFIQCLRPDIAEEIKGVLVHLSSIQPTSMEAPYYRDTNNHLICIECQMVFANNPSNEILKGHNRKYCHTLRTFSSVKPGAESYRCPSCPGNDVSFQVVEAFIHHTRLHTVTALTQSSVPPMISSMGNMQPQQSRQGSNAIQQAQLSPTFQQNQLQQRFHTQQNVHPQQVPTVSARSVQVSRQSCGQKNPLDHNVPPFPRQLPTHSHSGQYGNQIPHPRHAQLNAGGQFPPNVQVHHAIQHQNLGRQHGPSALPMGRMPMGGQSVQRFQGVMPNHVHNPAVSGAAMASSSTHLQALLSASEGLNSSCAERQVAANVMHQYIATSAESQSGRHQDPQVRSPPSNMLPMEANIPHSVQDVRRLSAGSGVVQHPRRESQSGLPINRPIQQWHQPEIDSSHASLPKARPTSDVNTGVDLSVSKKQDSHSESHNQPDGSRMWHRPCNIPQTAVQEQSLVSPGTHAVQGSVLGNPSPMESRAVEGQQRTIDTGHSNTYKPANVSGPSNTSRHSTSEPPVTSVSSNTLRPSNTSVHRTSGPPNTSGPINTSGPANVSMPLSTPGPLSISGRINTAGPPNVIAAWSDSSIDPSKIINIQPQEDGADDATSPTQTTLVTPQTSIKAETTKQRKRVMDSSVIILDEEDEPVQVAVNDQVEMNTDVTTCTRMDGQGNHTEPNVLSDNGHDLVQDRSSAQPVIANDRIPTTETSTSPLTVNPVEGANISTQSMQSGSFCEPRLRTSSLSPSISGTSETASLSPSLQNHPFHAYNEEQDDILSSYLMSSAGKDMLGSEIPRDTSPTPGSSSSVSEALKVFHLAEIYKTVKPLKADSVSPASTVGYESFEDPETDARAEVYHPTLEDVSEEEGSQSGTSSKQSTAAGVQQGSSTSEVSHQESMISRLSAITDQNYNQMLSQSSSVGVNTDILDISDDDDCIIVIQD